LEFRSKLTRTARNTRLMLQIAFPLSFPAQINRFHSPFSEKPHLVNFTRNANDHIGSKTFRAEKNFPRSDVNKTFDSQYLATGTSKRKSNDTSLP
jgi:hypothetical protein